MKITEWISDLDYYSKIGAKLWLTPGSQRPYWASQASFMYDSVIAHPSDFLVEAGYDHFEEDHDYEDHDEQITIEVELNAST